MVVSLQRNHLENRLENVEQLLCNCEDITSRDRPGSN